MIGEIAVPEATAHSQAGVASTLKSKITRPAADRNSRIAGDVQKWLI
jgi:hypothetical protein